MKALGKLARDWENRITRVGTGAVCYDVRGATRPQNRGAVATGSGSDSLKRCEIPPNNTVERSRDLDPVATAPRFRPSVS